MKNETLDINNKKTYDYIGFVLEVCGGYHPEYIITIKKFIIDNYLEKNSKAIIKEFFRFRDYTEYDDNYDQDAIDILKLYIIYLFHLEEYEIVVAAYKLLKKIELQINIKQSKACDIDIDSINKYKHTYETASQIFKEIVGYNACDL